MDKNHKILLVVAVLIGIGVALWLWSRQVKAAPPVQDPVPDPLPNPGEGLDYIVLVSHTSDIISFEFLNQVTQRNQTMGFSPALPDASGFCPLLMEAWRLYDEQILTIVQREFMIGQWEIYYGGVVP